MKTYETQAMYLNLLNSESINIAKALIKELKKFKGRIICTNSQFIDEFNKQPYTIEPNDAGIEISYNVYVSSTGAIDVNVHAYLENAGTAKQQFSVGFVVDNELEYIDSIADIERIWRIKRNNTTKSIERKIAKFNRLKNELLKLEVELDYNLIQWNKL